MQSGESMVVNAPSGVQTVMTTGRILESPQVFSPFFCISFSLSVVLIFFLGSGRREAALGGATQPIKKKNRERAVIRRCT